jgi:phospholipid/cholesterol/gamma-HCH transport system permease protein
VLRVATDRLESLGRAVMGVVGELGFGAALLGQSLFFLVLGKARQQPVRLTLIFREAMEVGIRALPIVSILAAAIGVMLAIQGIYMLSAFGAQERVTTGIALSVLREFSPLITGILVAGRSGSALAARLGTMTINQEVAALEVMAINPVRYLVVPPLVAMVIIVPALTMWSNITAILGAGLFVSLDLGISMGTYLERVMDTARTNDLLHGLSKSALFGILIAVIGVVNGASVKGGAEGVGRVTTRSVVHSISAIVIADMIVAFVLTR